MRDETFLVHLVEDINPHKPINFPIYLTANFYFDSTGEARKIFEEGAKWPTDSIKKGYVYARGATPTTRALELSIAKIEGGKDCVVFDSGMSAIFSCLFSLVNKNDKILVAAPVYGETYWVFEKLREKTRTNILWYEGWSTEEFCEIIKREKPKIVYLECPSNPLLKVFDIKTVKDHCENSILIVDNTFASPIIQKPLKLRADVVIESLTKFFSGHSDVLGGSVCSENEEIIWKVRESLFVSGGVLDSFSAWLIMRSMKTMHLRVERQSKNAEEIAKFLEEKGLKVYYPGLESHPNHKIAKKQMRYFGSILSIDFGDYEKARKFADNLKIIKRAVSLGAVESLVNHPASMTHSMIPEKIRKKMGITEGLVRLSIGIESVEDLIEDIENALNY